MTAVDYFAWFVFIVILVSLVGVFVALAQLPGQTARARNHPQADAINVAGWLGLLLTLGVVWALALVWAYTKPLTGVAASSDDGGELEALRSRVAELETRLAALAEAQP